MNSHKIDRSKAIPTSLLVARLRKARAAIDEALAPFETTGQAEGVSTQASDLRPMDSVFVRRPDNPMEWPGWFPDMEHLSLGIYEIASLHSATVDTSTGEIQQLGVELVGEDHLLNANWLRKVGS